MIAIDKDNLMDDLLSLSSDVGKMGFEWLGRDDVFETVRAQDEVEVDEWFDVKDDLPDDSGPYLITAKTCDGRTFVDIAVWNNGWWYVYNGDVIAWRYMPEPYRRDANG